MVSGPGGGGEVEGGWPLVWLEGLEGPTVYT